MVEWLMCCCIAFAVRSHLFGHQIDSLREIRFIVEYISSEPNIDANRCAASL